MDFHSVVTKIQIASIHNDIYDIHSLYFYYKFSDLGTKQTRLLNKALQVFLFRQHNCEKT